MEVDEGGDPLPVPPASSWAATVGADDRDVASSIPIAASVLEKLKKVVIDSVRVDDDSKLRARARFRHALYGKLLGKAPPFEIVRSTLLGMWKAIDSNIAISDMPNGFLLIRCESEGAKEQLLFGGPWAVHGVTLQLAPWQPGFEPAFSKLTKALVWVQLHNLPVDYWDEESLEMHSASIGKLVKVDDCTTSLSRTRFARVCLEIDLAVPLKRGFWLEDGDKRTFVMVMYERAPTFCYTCGIVGHESSACTDRRDHASEHLPVTGRADVGAGSSAQDAPAPRTDCEISHADLDPLVGKEATEDPGFGWIRPPRRRGRGRGRGEDGRTTARELHAPLAGTRHGQLASDGSLRHVERNGRESDMGCHVGTDERGMAFGDRGGRMGCDRGGRLGYGGSFHLGGSCDPPSARNIAAITGGHGGRQEHGESYHPDIHCVPSTSHHGAVFLDNTSIHLIPESSACVDDRTGGSEDDDPDGSAKGKRKAISSPPLLLMSSMDQRDERYSDEHRSLVARVEHALQANLVSSGLRRDDTYLEADSEMDGSDDDRPLWELQKSVRKDSRTRKGLQILGGVQKKKGKKMAGGKST